MKKLNKLELTFIVKTLKFLNPYDLCIDKIHNNIPLTDKEEEYVKHTLFGRDLYGSGHIEDNESNIYSDICYKLCHKKSHTIL